MSKLYAGLDVSLELTSVCVVDVEGRIAAEAKVPSDPAAISAALLALDGSFERVGLEAGPLSQWLYFGLKDAGLPVCCIETGHAKAAISAMSHNKTDAMTHARSRNSALWLVQERACEVRREPGAEDAMLPHAPKTRRRSRLSWSGGRQRSGPTTSTCRCGERPVRWART